MASTSRSRGMGRGLAAILSPTSASAMADDVELRRLPVEVNAPNPLQPRRSFDEAGLLALAASLKERGVLQPVLVRPLPSGTYELIAGERRWRAAQLAGFDTVPALVRPDDDAASVELALIENMAREDLNPVEEARACALLVDELGVTREELGRRIGRSRVAVSNLLRLLDLPDDELDLLVEGRLTEGHGRALLMAEDHGERRRLARAAADAGWTVRQTEERARAASPTPRRPGGRPRRTPAPHPDQVAAAERLQDVFSRAFAADVAVAPRGDGFAITLTLASQEEADAFAARVLSACAGD